MERLGIEEENAAGAAVSLANFVPATQSLFLVTDSGDQIFRRASLADARDPAQCAGYEGSFGNPVFA